MSIIFQLVGILFSFFHLFCRHVLLSWQGILSQQSVKQRRSTYLANKGKAVLKLSKQVWGCVVLGDFLDQEAHKTFSFLLQIQQIKGTAFCFILINAAKVCLKQYDKQIFLPLKLECCKLLICSLVYSSWQAFFCLRSLESSRWITTKSSALSNKTINNKIQPTSENKQKAQTGKYKDRQKNYYNYTSNRKNSFFCQVCQRFPMKLGHVTYPL